MLNQWAVSFSICAQRTIVPHLRIPVVGICALFQNGFHEDKTANIKG